MPADYAAPFRFRHACLAIFIFLIGLTLAGSARADGPRRAGLVVHFGGGRTQTACVAFTGDSISGMELLRRAGFNLVTAYAGTAVCKIDDLGCPSDNCFCQSYAPPYAYWAYFHSHGDGNWSYSQVGAADYQVRDGQVDGWSWGPGESSPPPGLRFDEICLAPTAIPTSTPAATSTPLAPTPTLTPRPPTATPRPPTSTPIPPIATALPTEAPATATTSAPPATRTALSTVETPAEGLPPLAITATRRPATATQRPLPTPSPSVTLTPVSTTPQVTPSHTQTAGPSTTSSNTSMLSPLSETTTPAPQPSPAPTAVAAAASAAGQPLAYGVFIVMVVGLLGLLVVRSKPRG